MVDAHKGVDLGQQIRQIIAETLGKAAGDNECLVGLMRLAQFIRFKDDIDTFFLSRIDKGAGVDDERVGLSRVVYDLDAILKQRPKHDLRIDRVFGAT